MAGSYDAEALLCEALSSRSDVELLCDDGKAISAHSLKLSFDSPVLSELLDLMEGNEVTSAKRPRSDEGPAKPQLKVGPMQHACTV